MPPIEDQLEIIGRLETTGRLALAALFGGVIGLERELRGYPAGIRTLALVTMGSLLFTDVSQLLGGDDRVAAGIVTGIGFLGAGVIFREGYTVRGITTAATIWSAAAVGMAVAGERALAAGLGSLLIFALLEARPVVRRLDNFVGTRLLGLKARQEAEQEEAEEGRGRDG